MLDTRAESFSSALFCKENPAATAAAKGFTAVHMESAKAMQMIPGAMPAKQGLSPGLDMHLAPAGEGSLGLAEQGGHDMGQLLRKAGSTMVQGGVMS